MPTPGDIKSGDPIYANWLNRSKNAAVTDIRVAAPLNMHRAGGKVTISLPNRQIIPPHGAIVLVYMEKTGGNAGDATTQCSYTYTIKSVGGDVLRSDVNPGVSPELYRRPTLGQRLTATAGLATVIDEVMTIVWCNEADDLESC